MKKNKIDLISALKFAVIKNFIFPLIMLGLLLIIKPPRIISFLIFLQSAMPPVTTVPVLIERAGGQTSLVNQLLFSSFVFSLVSIPLMLWLYDLFFSFL